MIFQRIVLAVLFPLVAGFAFDPRSAAIDSTPLCHDKYDESDFSPETKVDVKAFLAINKMCPVQLPFDQVTQRKMAFTLNPFRSDSMTISDGIILARCMLARGVLMARSGLSSSVVTGRNMLASAINVSAQKCRTTATLFKQFCAEPFTFADHIMPERGGFSNGIALIISGIFAIATVALEYHQRTLAKLLKQDLAAVSKVESDMKRNMYASVQQEEMEHLELEESAKQSEVINEVIEGKMIASINNQSQRSGLPFITEEQPEVVSADKSVGPGETSSEGSESGSTFLETPPPTPPRYMIDMNMKKAAKAAKDDMTTVSASPKRKRKLLGFKLRRKNKTQSSE